MIESPDIKKVGSGSVEYSQALRILGDKLIRLKSLFIGIKDSKVYEENFDEYISLDYFGELILKAIKKGEKLQTLFDKSLKIDDPEKDEDFSKREYSDISDNMASLYKALITGLAVFAGMMLWRKTGWPGGYVVPLLSMFQVMFSIINPSLTITMLVILQVISIVFAAIVSFFILPSIFSTELFFIFIVLLYSFFGMLLHSSKLPLRGYRTYYSMSCK